MARFYLQGVNQTSTRKNQSATNPNHDLSVSAKGATAGTITITGRKVGSDIFESIPDGVIDLAAINSIQFIGTVQEYRFDVAGFTGTGNITITDTTWV